MDNIRFYTLLRWTYSSKVGQTAIPH